METVLWLNQPVHSCILAFLILSVIRTMVKICVYCCLLSAVSIVEMKILKINGHVGEDVEIKCSEWNSWSDVKYNDKYFCKSPCTEDKHIINKAAFGKTTNKHRVELTNSGYKLYVIFKNLQKSDSDTYYCGVDRFGRDLYIKVILFVTDAKSSSPKTTPHTVSVGSTLSYPVTNSSTPASSSPDIISDVSLSYMSSNTSTSPASVTQGAGSVPYLIVGAVVMITLLMLILKLMSKMRKHHFKVLSSADTPQQDAEEVVEYDEIRPEDPTDSACLYANYCYHQDTARTGNVSLNSSSRSEVDSGWACAESRVMDPQCDLVVYSVAQLPRELTEHTGQSEQNQTERNENDSLYSLAQLPEAFLRRPL